MRGIMQELQPKIQEVLTPEQQKLLRQKMQDGRGGQGEPGAGGAGPGAMIERMKQMVGKLELSEDQKTKIEAIFADFKTKAQDIQKAADGKGSGRDQMRQLMQDTRSSVQQVLTPEQQQKLAEMLKREAGDKPGPGNGPKPQRQGKPGGKKPAGDANGV